MTQNPIDVDYPEYLAAMPLIEALCTYAQADTLQAFDRSFATQSSDKPQFAQVLMALGETLSEADKLTTEQSALLAAMKTEVMALVTSGDLVPAGFLMPRGSTDRPVALDGDIFVAAQVNWDKSEVVAENREFHAVRLLEIPLRKLRVNKFQRSGGIANNTKKTDALTFHHLTEKNAAIYLGVSSRALQQLRVAGKGPAFTKSGQAIRYTKENLDQWLVNNR